MPVPRFEFTLSEGPRILRSLQLTVAADEWGWDEFEVANGASDASILPGNITTVDVLYIESDQTVTYELNGADTRITLDPQKAHILFGTAVTAITISNGSGATANMKLGWWGT